MKRKTPLITLLAGAALGVILLIASMLAATKTPARGYGGGSGAAGPAPATGGTTTAPGGTTTAPGSTAAPGGTTAAPAIPGCTAATAPASPLRHVRQSAVTLGGRPFEVRTTPDRRFSFATLGDTLGDTLGGTLAVLSNGAGPAPVLAHTLRVPGGAKGEAITGDGKYLLLATGGGAKVLSAAAAEQGKVVVLGTLDSPRGSDAVQVVLSPDDQFAFVTLQGSGGVAVFNLRHALAGGFASSLVGTIPTGKQTVGIAVSPDPAHQWLYVASWGPPGTISVVDLRRAETDPAAALTLPPAPAGCRPSRVMTSPDGSIVWVTAQGSDALLAFSAARLRTDPAHALTAAVQVGQNPIGETFINGSRRIVVADSGSSPPSLMVIDAQQALCRAGKRALVGSIPSGAAPRGLGLDGATLLVTDQGSGQLDAVSINDIPLTTAGTPPPGHCGNGG